MRRSGGEPMARIAFVADRDFEDSELRIPWDRIREAGHQTVLVGLEKGKRIEGKRGKETFTTEVAARDVSADDFDAVVVPGGWAPDKLRRYAAVTGFVRRMYDGHKVVALICHAGLVGISAGVVAGHRATGCLGIKDALVNAGATWVDEPAFRDGNLVWGRVVEDIPAFCRELVAAIEAG